MTNVIKKKTIFFTALLVSLCNHVIADVAVIVHPSNTATIDIGVTTKLFLGKERSYSTGDTAIVVVHTGSSSEEFNEKVLKRSSSQFKAYWARLVFSGKASPPTSLSGDAEVKKVVSSNANTIGYIDASQVDDSVKVLFIM
jgi:ABC-type phosphate transport system substrate-binding protein